MLRGKEIIRHPVLSEESRSVARSVASELLGVVGLFMETLPRLSEPRSNSLIRQQVALLMDDADRLREHSLGPLGSTAVPANVSAHGISTSSDLPGSSSMRRRVVQELFDTEKTFCDSMEAFSRAFVNPLKPKNGSGDEGTLSDLVLSALGAAPPPQPHELLSADEHELLFGAVEVQVLPLSHMMLEMLEAALGTWDAGTSVGRILFRFAPWLKIYSVAFLRQLEAPQLLQRLGEDRPGFTEFLEAASASCGGQTIDSFLILPVQRVPRFRLLFEQLLKHTPPDHPDYVLCAEALAEVGCKDGRRGVGARSLTNPWCRAGISGCLEAQRVSPTLRAEPCHVPGRAAIRSAHAGTCAAAPTPAA